MWKKKIKLIILLISIIEYSYLTQVKKVEKLTLPGIDHLNGINSAKVI